MENDEPKSTIIKEQLEGYNNLISLGFEHISANHSLNFVNPVTGHTQLIEYVVNVLIRKFRVKTINTNFNTYDSFYELIFKRTYKENCFLKILENLFR